uniref:DDE Tnp4 domain-containing protein n=1 Tax=Fagus sylvatica TaxID=28930 RepID=A0A2N9IKV7_FAGSY
MNHSLFLRIHSAVEAHESYFIQKRDVARRLGLSSLQKMTVTIRMLAYGVIELSKCLERPGHIREATTILEVVASYDLWIWHAFFGLPGSHNDINVLKRSPVFAELAQGRTPQVNYSINGNDHSMGYYLADGIYPSWATFVKTIPVPQGNKRQLFAHKQEEVRKDVEHASDMLQARFAIVRKPAHDFDYEQFDGIQPEPISHHRTPQLTEFIQRHQSIRDKGSHSKLQADLVEHIWQVHGK